MNNNIQPTLTLNGNPIKLEELEAYKRKLQESSGQKETVVEVSPGVYKTKQRLNG